jgi:excisionase family DNA binding protein
MSRKKIQGTEAGTSDLITPTEAARVRGVTRSAIAALIKRGRLQVVEIGGRPFLRRGEVESFEAEKPGPKVPEARQK